MKVAITGATGFVGSRVLSRLRRGEVVAIGRRKPATLSDGRFFNLLIHPDTDYCNALVGVDVVIHCAALAHIVKNESGHSLAEYRKVNTGGSINLAQQAAKHGVRRFIFISSIKVNGEQTQADEPFKPEVNEEPVDSYGLSKYEAEIGLKQIAKETGMEIVIIRPPLVYGPGVKANFASMLKMASTGLPLPLGGVTQNRRSLVFIENLVDLIVTCIDHPAAANETFLVSDDEDLSTADMFSRLRRACGKSGWLFSIPDVWFDKILRLIGKPEVYDRLCGSLQVDITDTIKKLDWYPPDGIDKCFAETAKHYLDNK